MGYLKAYLRLSRPGSVPRLSRVYRPLRGIYRVLWTVTHPKSWRRRVEPIAVIDELDEMELL